MIFQETKLPGAFVIDPERITDERGFFARTYCADEFRAHGLVPELSQASLSFSTRAGTLRGMHYQVPPHEETKLVRCTRGAIHDVIVDLRPGAGTFTQWFCVELSAQNRRMLYIPRGLAHGFLTLEDQTEVCYLNAGRYHLESARGVRHDDVAFGIDWPGETKVICDRDRDYPDFSS